MGSFMPTKSKTSSQKPPGVASRPTPEGGDRDKETDRVISPPIPQPAAPRSLPSNISPTANEESSAAKDASQMCQAGPSSSPGGKTQPNPAKGTNPDVSPVSQLEKGKSPPSLPSNTTPTANDKAPASRKAFQNCQADPSPSLVGGPKPTIVNESTDSNPEVRRSVSPQQTKICAPPVPPSITTAATTLPSGQTVPRTSETPGNSAKQPEKTPSKWVTKDGKFRELSVEEYHELTHAEVLTYMELKTILGDLRTAAPTPGKKSLQHPPPDASQPDRSVQVHDHNVELRERNRKEKQHQWRGNRGERNHDRMHDGPNRGSRMHDRNGRFHNVRQGYNTNGGERNRGPMHDGPNRGSRMYRGNDTYPNMRQGYNTKYGSHQTRRGFQSNGHREPMNDHALFPPPSHSGHREPMNDHAHFPPPSHFGPIQDYNMSDDRVRGGYHSERRLEQAPVPPQFQSRQAQGDWRGHGYREGAPPEWRRHAYQEGEPSHAPQLHSRSPFTNGLNTPANDAVGHLHDLKRSLERLNEAFGHSSSPHAPQRSQPFEQRPNEYYRGAFHSHNKRYRKY